MAALSLSLSLSLSLFLSRAGKQLRGKNVRKHETEGMSRTSKHVTAKITVVPEVKCAFQSYRLIMLGPAQCGKTSLVDRFFEKGFEDR